MLRKKSPPSYFVHPIPTYSNQPIPKYAKEWSKKVFRPKVLPDGYDARIDPAHIFALPEGPDGPVAGGYLIVAHRCARCSKARAVCSRGIPCRRCEANGVPCVPAEKGYVPLPFYQPRITSIRNEVVALQKAVPDAPYYQRLGVPQAADIAYQSLYRGNNWQDSDNTPARKSARLSQGKGQPPPTPRQIRAAERAKVRGSRKSSRRSANKTDKSRPAGDPLSEREDDGNASERQSSPLSRPSSPELLDDPVDSAAGHSQDAAQPDIARDEAPSDSQAEAGPSSSDSSAVRVPDSASARISHRSVSFAPPPSLHHEEEVVVAAVAAAEHEEVPNESDRTPVEPQNVLPTSTNVAQSDPPSSRHAELARVSYRSSLTGPGTSGVLLSKSLSAVTTGVREQATPVSGHVAHNHSLYWQSYGLPQQSGPVSYHKAIVTPGSQVPPSLPTSPPSVTSTLHPSRSVANTTSTVIDTVSQGHAGKNVPAPASANPVRLSIRLPPIRSLNKGAAGSSSSPPLRLSPQRTPPSRSTSSVIALNRSHASSQSRDQSPSSRVHGIGNGPYVVPPLLYPNPSRTSGTADADVDHSQRRHPFDNEDMVYTATSASLSAFHPSTDLSSTQNNRSPAGPSSISMARSPPALQANAAMTALHTSLSPPLMDSLLPPPAPESAFHLSTSAAWTQVVEESVSSDSDSEIGESRGNRSRVPEGTKGYKPSAKRKRSSHDDGQADVVIPRPLHLRPRPRSPTVPRLEDLAVYVPHPSVVIPPRTAQEDYVKGGDGDDAYDSEEEVLQTLKRTRCSDSADRSPPTGDDVSEINQQLTFVPLKRMMDNTIAVKVHDTLYHLPRTRLAQHSDYFADLIAKIPNYVPRNVTGPEEGLDRCPVLQVTGVSSKDFEALLKAFDNIGMFVESPPHYSTMIAVFCAARTLRFGQLDAFATFKLCAIWSSELQRVSPARIPYAAETVILSRMYNVPAILKRAFYELLRTPGFDQQGIVSRTASDAPLDGSEIIGHAKLSHADLVRLVTAREKLLLTWTLLVGSAPNTSSFRCPLQGEVAPSLDDPISEARERVRNRCAEAWKNNTTIWAEKVLDSGFYETWMYDPICGLEHLAAMTWSETGLCVSCIRARQSVWLKKREEIWGSLDIWLGI